MSQKNLEAVDWSAIPAPIDDGAANHLQRMSLPEVALKSISGGSINVGALKGWTIIYFYPMTGQPGVPLPDGWDDIPGARGCTPQSCSFRDLSQKLKKLGVDNIYGISTQPSDYQKEAADRLHLPFALLSDEQRELTDALNLPIMEVNENILIKRLTLIVHNSEIQEVFYPVFPPDRNADDVLQFMRNKSG